MSTTRAPCANAVWFLVGPFDTTEMVRCLPVYTFPFMIGRRQDLAMALACKTVSTLHAEITEVDKSLVLRDLGSTNGTYVNGKRVTEAVVLEEDDLIQFANMAYRVRHQLSHESTHTIQEDACDRAMALVQFDKLMTEHAVTPYFQPIVSIASRELAGYEVLARSNLFGLETPKEMFTVATQLNLEVELSVMLRWEGVHASLAMPEPPHLFLNTHPRELAQPGLIESLRTLRSTHPDQRLTLEIHESAVTGAEMMAQIAPELRDLRISLAYDDFGAGQSRLNELVEGSPAYVKFDMSLIRDIDSATPQRKQVVSTLVQMVRNLGIIALAEGVETESESNACQEMGFELGQGYYYGRPAPARNASVSS